MVGFNIFPSLDLGRKSSEALASPSSTSPRNLIIRETGSDEPSALASVSSSYLEAIPEEEEEEKSSEGSNEKQPVREKASSRYSTEVVHSIDGTTSLDVSRVRGSHDGEEERDYDENPTQLYTLLQSRAWAEAINRIETYPSETKIWIYRTETDGCCIRWRLLPLHASIIFKAPVEVVESIITVFPDAAKMCDDQSSLPIHLAYKRGASASTFRVLLECYPECIDVKDAKGRTARQLSRTGCGPRHVEFVYALKVHLAGREAAREEARVEEEKKYNLKLEDARKSHEEKLEKIREKNQIQIEELKKKIKSLEEDVEVSQSVSKTLNENIAEFQKELKRHKEAETLLARQVAEKNAEIEESKRMKTANEERLELELNRLAAQIADLRQEISKLLLEKEILNKSLEAVVESTEWEKRKLEKKIEEQRKTIEALKQAARKSDAEKVKLKVELQKKEDKERDLSETIENLETQLKFRSTNANETAKAAKAQVKSLEGERDVLKDSNNKMSSQLKSVATFLGEMKEEQIAIVDQAAEHEREMEAVTKEHARILEEIEEQQKRDLEAQEGRLVLASLIQAQEQEMARNVKARKMIQDAILLQSQRIQKAASKREELVTNAQKVGRQVEEKVKGVLGSMPNTSVGMTEDADSLHDVAGSSHASFYWSQASTAADPAFSEAEKTDKKPGRPIEQ